MGRQKAKISFYVEPELKTEVEKFCNNTCQTLSEYCRNLIREHLMEFDLIQIKGKDQGD